MNSHTNPKRKRGTVEALGGASGLNPVCQP
jgi:hypothetical protein